MLEAAAIDDTKADDRGEVAVCPAKDTLEAAAIDDTNADDRSVVEVTLTSDPDDEDGTEEATAASATVGTSDWAILSVAPGVEHPTPPRVLLTAI